MLPLLRCVRCRPGGRLSLAADDAQHLSCDACGARYPLREGVPVLLRDVADLVEPDAGDASSNSYSRQSVAFFEALPDDWVLDCGCGLPLENLPNVVHLDIVAHPRLDVVASSDALPFAEGVFAAVTCESVLEHVPDPWAVADELHRVLAPGGVVRADVPFLAPFHAYPNHFHNFTQTGLERLMRRFERLDGGIGPHQEPWVAIAWILRLAREGLPDDARRHALDQTTFGEALRSFSEGVPPSTLHPLSDEVRTALAAGFYFYGRKPRG